MHDSALHAIYRRGRAGAIGLGLRRARAFLNDACGRARFVAGKSLAVHIGSPLAPGLLPSHPNARVFLPALEQPELAVNWVRFALGVGSMLSPNIEFQTRPRCKTYPESGAEGLCNLESTLYKSSFSPRILAAPVLRSRIIYFSCPLEFNFTPCQQRLPLKVIGARNTIGMDIPSLECEHLSQCRTTVGTRDPAPSHR